jgi:hypothetical protein
MDLQWPDIEIELVSWLAADQDVRVVTELPSNLVEVLPLIQVQRVGGDDDGFRLDRALVDLDVYASTRQAASDLARSARSGLLGHLRGTSTGAAVFNHISTVAAPSWRPYENVNLRRYGGTYQLFFHPVVS